MSSNRHRKFSLREERIFGVPLADNSDDEDDLRLDEENQTFLAHDMDADMSTIVIEPSSASLVKNIIDSCNKALLLHLSIGGKTPMYRTVLVRFKDITLVQEHILDCTYTSDMKNTPVKCYSAVGHFGKCGKSDK